MSYRGKRKRANRAAHITRVMIQSKAEFYMTLGGQNSCRGLPKIFNQKTIDARHEQLGRDWA
jgi:hypothetical protein